MTAATTVTKNSGLTVINLKVTKEEIGRAHV